MFSVTDLKASISSIEFSFFLESSPRLCPNCRQVLENDFLTEVRISSLVLLLGVGSLVCYKWLTEKKKQKKGLPFGISKAMNSQHLKNNKSFNEYNDSFGDSKIRRYKMLSSTPFVGLCQSLALSPSIISSDGSDLVFNFAEFSDDIENSMEKSSLQKIGNNTVAKLDQLLEQIQDIKQSVYDIDEQIFDVKESNVKFEPKMFSLGPDMSSSINTESDLNEKFNYLNTEPQTPTLEWDLTDLNGFNANNGHNFNETQLISSMNSSLLISQSINDNSKIFPQELNQLESPQDLTSPSISTSGEFSISSASEQSKEHNLAVIQRMISEAKKLGLLKDLIDILVKNTKRDSAYFED